MSFRLVEKVSTATQAVGSGAAQLAQSANPMAYAVDTLFRSNNLQAPENAADSAAEAGRILARSMAQGSLSAEDKSYLAQLIAARTGLPQPEASSA